MFIPRNTKELRDSLKNVRVFQDRIEIWKSWFLRRGENGRARKKPLGAEERTKNKLYPHITPDLEIEPGNIDGDERSHHYVIPVPIPELAGR